MIHQFRLKTLYPAVNTNGHSIIVLNHSNETFFIIYECWTDLMWAYTGGVEVGVTSSRINGVLFKVLTDVFCGGLRQQSINALPEEQKGR